MTYFYFGGGRLVIQDRITWRITCIYVGFSATQDDTLLLTMSSSRTWIFENTRRSRLRFDGSDRRRKNTVPDSTLKKRTRVQLLKATIIILYKKKWIRVQPKNSIKM